MNKNPVSLDFSTTTCMKQLNKVTLQWIKFCVKNFFRKCEETSSSVGIYLPKVNNRNTRTRCEICSKLTIKTQGRCQWRHSGVFIVNIKHLSHFLQVFLLLTLNTKLPTSSGLRIFLHVPKKLLTENFLFG